MFLDTHRYLAVRRLHMARLAHRLVRVRIHHPVARNRKLARAATSTVRRRCRPRESPWRFHHLPSRRNFGRKQCATTKENPENFPHAISISERRFRLPWPPALWGRASVFCWLPWLLGFLLPASARSPTLR